VQQVPRAAKLGLHGVLPDLDVELQQRHGSALISLQAVRKSQMQTLPAEATVAAKIRHKLQLLQDADWNVKARIRCSVERNAQVRAMNKLGCHKARYARQCQKC